MYFKIYLTNKVRNKETKFINSWQKYKIRIGFEPGTSGQKANTITTELKKILSYAAVRYCIKIGKQPCLKEWSSVTHPHLKSSFIDDGKRFRQKVHFWTINGINALWPIPYETPSYYQSP